MFNWLENTAVALWVGESLWAYPLLLSLHIVGLAVVVGIFSMRDMRLLGLFPAIQPAAFLSLNKLAWTGFGLNAVSGFLLFTSQATTFIASTPFLVKIGCIAIAMVLAAIIQYRLRKELLGKIEKHTVIKSTRTIAAASISLWMAAIFAGRLIAYL